VVFLCDFLGFSSFSLKDTPSQCILKILFLAEVANNFTKIYYCRLKEPCRYSIMLLNKFLILLGGTCLSSWLLDVLILFYFSGSHVDVVPTDNSTSSKHSIEQSRFPLSVPM
jgi:hypothetical protein